MAKKDDDRRKKTYSYAERKRDEGRMKAAEKEEKDEKGFIKLAMKRLKIAVDSDSHNREASIDDLRFSFGIDVWNSKVESDRKKDGRPCLHFDLITENLNQVIGDQRHNKVRCKVRAVDGDADPEIARLRQGIVSNIEYLSGAERIYDYSMEMMCRGGYAAWEIKTRYTEENPFLQEIYMERIPNPHCVYFGPCRDECHADARYAFKFEKMPLDDFKAEYPGRDVPDKSFQNEKGMGHEMWYDGNTVMVADYWVIKSDKREMALLSDGRVMEKKDAEEEVRNERDYRKAGKVIENKMMSGGNALQGIQSATEPPQLPDQSQSPEGSPITVDNTSGNVHPSVGSPALPEEPEVEDENELRIVKTRETLINRVKHYKISPMEILSENGLEGEDFPGSFIPLILVQGPEINIEGKPYVRSFIRPAKDPQRNYDYWVSAAAESVALAPKAEFIGTAKQFEGYEKDYALSNQKNFPFLKYNVDDEFADKAYFPPPPQRVATKDPPIGMFTEMGNSRMAVKDALGMHARDVGDQGPERSGQAITNIQRPADIGAFMFFDNLKRSIEHSHRVINSMIAEVYDSDRDIRIRDETDKTTFVPVNTDLISAISRVKKEPERYIGMDLSKMRKAMREHGGDARFNDLTIGKYNVISTTGPAYATQRAESADQMLRLATVDNRIMAVGGDLIVRSMDFQYADELADRIEMTLPRGMVKPREGKVEPPPPPPDPKVQLIMQRMNTEMIKRNREIIKTKVELVKLLKEIKETDAEVRKQVIKVLDELTSPEPIPGEEGWNPEAGKGKGKGRSRGESTNGLST